MSRRFVKIEIAFCNYACPYKSGNLSHPACRHQDMRKEGNIYWFSEKEIDVIESGKFPARCPLPKEV